MHLKNTFCGSHRNLSSHQFRGYSWSQMSIWNASVPLLAQGIPLISYTDCCLAVLHRESPSFFIEKYQRHTKKNWKCDLHGSNWMLSLNGVSLRPGLRFYSMAENTSLFWKPDFQPDVCISLSPISLKHFIWTAFLFCLFLNWVNLEKSVKRNHTKITKHYPTNFHSAGSKR